MSTARVLPKSYTAYHFEEANSPLVKVELPWKEPQENEVVVEVLASGVCGSDHCVRAGLIGNSWPRVPGHEIVGDIVSKHPSVTNFKIGQRVGVPWNSRYCYKCRFCRSGVFEGCVERSAYTIGGARDGGYAQYVVVPADGLCSVPEVLDPAEVAPMMCAGVTVYSTHSVNGWVIAADESSPESLLYLNIPPGAVVAIQGVGGLGHLAIQFCRAMGYKTVAVSSSGAKRDIALQLGAHVYIDESKVDAVQELRRLGGADVIMSTVPCGQVTMKLLAGLAYEGKLVVLGLSEETAVFAPRALPPNRWSIHGFLCGTAKDCEDTIEFAMLHDIRCIVEKFPLDQAWEAFQHLEHARFRAVIVP
ncbi:hypothetical protein NM688_g5212 [Phlebia brevispora]|uniref:Uncharacterized protein n=1 Tax=Phlebia brevispora TaxID=194682 RepID=A0ACC1SZ14_9APHY|nr:hypothetical protein NM688_g5212 [Phlebia brevispora]